MMHISITVMCHVLVSIRLAIVAFKFNTFGGFVSSINIYALKHPRFEIWEAKTPEHFAGRTALNL